MNWRRGSEWTKRDLHVHSPASANFNGDWNQFIIQLGNADCDVVGINDYCSVAGYKEVRRRISDCGAASEGNKPYHEALERLESKTLLPVVECRMNNIVLGKKLTTGPRMIKWSLPQSRGNSVPRGGQGPCLGPIGPS